MPSPTVITAMSELGALIALCAPAVHPVTAHALIAHESGNHPWAIGINAPSNPGQGWPRLKLSNPPKTEAQAIALATTLIAKGYSVDMGYSQINSANLRRLGLTVSSVFKPCVNLNAMQTLLQGNYARASNHLGQGQSALKAALSSYNTGDPYRGLANGFVPALYSKASR